MCAYRVIPSTWGIQVHEVTSNTWIDQSVNQKRNEAPTIIPPWSKDINLGRLITIVYFCDEGEHDLPEGQRPKHINL